MSFYLYWGCGGDVCGYFHFVGVVSVRGVVVLWRVGNWILWFRGLSVFDIVDDVDIHFHWNSIVGHCRVDIEDM